MDWLLGGVGGGLLDYNRENFFFDKEQQLKREFQAQKVRITQFGLYREDVRDLMDLTVSKMENYLIVNAFQLTFCITLYTQGRPEGDNSPQWVHFLYAMTTASAFFYTLLSMWLAIHASISAHSFGVRMLTQLVRLPIPNKAQLDAATAIAGDFESSGLTSVMRVPLLAKQLGRLNVALDNLAVQGSGMSDAGSDDAGSDFATSFGSHAVSVSGAPVAPVSTLKHMRLYRELQANWQAYDAYARVSMAMGANQLLHAISYFTVRMLVSEERSPWPALACVAIMTFCAWLLARLDLYLTPGILAIAGALLLAPPFITMVGITIVHVETPARLFSDICAPLSFLFHMLWIGFILYVARAQQFKGVALPTNFRSVLYLDVFGWLVRPSRLPSQPGVTAPEAIEGAGEAIEGAGEAIQGAGQLAESDQPAEHRVHALSAVTEEQPDVDLLSSPAPVGDFPSTPGATPAMDRQPSFGRTLTTMNLRRRLVKLCEELRSGLLRDFSLWQNSDVVSMISDDAYTLRVVSELRERFDNVADRFNDAAPEAARLREDLDEEDPDAPKTWLELEWNPSGYPMTYFYRCDTAQTVWTVPKAPDRVSTLENLTEQLQMFDEKVQQLVEFLPVEPPLERVPTCAQEDPSTPASSREGHGVASPQAAPASFGGDSPSRLLLEPSPAAAEEEQEQDGPAQETRFGGREAVHLAEGTADHEAFFSSDAFHPHRQRVRHHSSAESSRRRPRRPPGQMPWRTFCQGSAFVIFVWSIGFCWCVARVWDNSIDIPVSTGPPVGARGEVEPIFAGPWPHAFFTPRGLACGGGGRSLLVAEEYGVHELVLGDEGGAWRDAEALRRCLAEDPEFHSRGLRGVAPLCAPASSAGGGGNRQARCGVVLLGASGADALHCDAGEGGPSRPNASTRLTLHGGPWRAVTDAAGLGVGAVGALRAKDGALFSLRQRSGHSAAAAPPAASPGLVPEFELYRGGGLVEAAVLGSSGVLLALHADGGLRAYRLQDGAGAQPMWSRQMPQGFQWSGMCASEEQDMAYFVGSSAQPRSASGLVLWQMRLPHEVHVSVQ